MKYSPMQMLNLAESFVEEYGDENWFREHYSLARQYGNVIFSIESALASQNLWSVFCKLHNIEMEIYHEIA